MSGRNYKKGLRRDIIIAFSIKVILIVFLIVGHNYYTKDKSKDEERYPIFGHSVSTTP